MKQRFRFDNPTILILLLALGLRLLVWRTLPYRDWISDEGEYWAAATWLAHGRGFAFFDGWVWSRPPLYLLFLAAQIKLFGPTALWAPRLAQALLSVLAVWLVMLIARRLAPRDHARPVALLAGGLMALSYSFATFAYLLLSETLFLVLFLGGVLALLRWGQALRTPGRTFLAAHRDLLLAGGLLGLAALTRAVILTWLPLVALWVWILMRRTADSANSDQPDSPPATPKSRLAAHARALIPVLLLTASVCVVVLPWTAYATARWGQGAGLILVDTTGGYNFAFGALKSLPKDNPEGMVDEDHLHDRLCGGVRCDGAQAARQAQAYALGWRWIREYPAGFGAKTGRELLDMLQIRYGGAERMRGGHTVGAVPGPHLVGLLWDDTLYMLALPLALLGLLRTQGRSGKGLVVGWLLYNVAIGALVFAINRFRQPLLPFVFIYAACALVQWRAVWPGIWRRRAGWIAASVAALLILPSYLYWPAVFDPNRRSSWHETGLGFKGLELAEECRTIEQTLGDGAVAEARRLHDQLDAQYPRPGLNCLALINAKLLQAEGQNEAALAFMHTAVTTDEVQAAKILMLEGDLLRRLGRLEEAFYVFVPRQVEVVNDTRWAWDNLDPPALARLDVGNGLDYGYLDGFFKRETAQGLDFRWSGAVARLRFPGAGTGQPQTVQLRVNGYTNEWQPTTITLSVNGQATAPLVLQPEWQTLSVPLPPTAPGAAVVVELRSSVFVNGPDDLALRVRDRTTQPLRLLGFQLDWAELK
ncbi:MAG: glycosyltransferase family 39 protein [Herpetosiphonaceae bacterium]|nr:glycosyltransferase family 39 protein [Herpetosiphonaceae bacterium]